MASTKNKKISDKELASILDQRLARTDRYGSTTLSDEYTEAMRYFNGELPKPKKNRSQYTELVVRDAIESIKAMTLNAIGRGKGICSFTAESAEDEEQARLATAYVDKAFYKLNDGTSILHDALHNGLLARNAVAKVWWEPRIEVEQEQFVGTEDQLALLLAEEENFNLPDDGIVVLDPATGLMTVLIEREVDKGQVRVQILPPEEFLIDDKATSIRDAKLVAHRSRRSIPDLVDEGYNEDALHEQASKNDTSNRPETTQRREDAGQNGVSDDDDMFDEGMVTVDECYIRINLDGTSVKRWMVKKVGDLILEKQVADAVLFVSFCPLPAANSFWGSNYAQQLIPTQNAKTTLMRSLLDQVYFASFPRYAIEQGALPNPGELTEVRFGGLVNTTKADAISLVPQPQPNPFIIPLMEQITASTEAYSGVSRTAMGLNHNVVGKQNSGALLDQVTAASQQKTTQIAARLARFLSETYLSMYEIALRYERKEVLVEVEGAFVPVSPEEWRERRHVSAEISLDPDAKPKEAQKLAATFAMFAQDPVLGALMGPEQRRYLAGRYLELMGQPGVNNVLNTVDKMPQPQPDPMLELQQKIVDAEREKNAALYQAQMAKIETAKMQAMIDIQIKAAKADAENAIELEKLDLKRGEQELDAARFDHQVKMDEAELELAQNTEIVKATVALGGTQL